MSAQILYQTGMEWPTFSPMIDRYRLDVERLERLGVIVIFERDGDTHVVKLRRKGHRQIRTSSTSGYPSEHAFHTLAQLLQDESIIEISYHDLDGEPVPNAQVRGDGSIVDAEDNLVGYKPRMGDTPIMLGDGELERVRGMADMIGLKNVYLIALEGERPMTVIPRARAIEAVTQ